MALFHGSTPIYSQEAKKTRGLNSLARPRRCSTRGVSRPRPVPGALGAAARRMHADGLKEWTFLPGLGTEDICLLARLAIDATLMHGSG
jgi:hypothetical protein